MSFRPHPKRLVVVCLQVALGMVPPIAASSENLALLPPILGATELYVSDRRSGLALEGYDALSYQLDEQPRAGHPDHEYLWQGLAWRFASAANRAAFVRDPDAFAPRLGGYDAERLANDVPVAGDPRIFVLRGGKLYLFHTQESRRRFLADDLAGRAEAGWQRLRPGLVQG